METKYFYQLFSIIFVFEISAQFVPKADSWKQFIVVSEASEAKQLYFRVKTAAKNTFFFRSTMFSIARKRKICRDITNSYLIRSDGEDPYEKFLGSVTRRLRRFRYPTRMIQTIIDQSVETVFVCLARVGWSNVKYYISREYDMNAGSKPSTPNRPSRFIFRNFSIEWPRLYGLAELPGQTFLSLDYNIESHYLRMKRTNTIASDIQYNTLCGLPKNYIRRICVAVFNSGYFEEKFLFSNAYDVSGYCEFQSVSFQTDEVKAQAGEESYWEWMLSCKPNKSDFKEVDRCALNCMTSSQDAREDEEDETTFEYWLSHAYQTDQIFVYFSKSDTEQVFLENLTVNVRLTFNPSTHD